MNNNKVAAAERGLTSIARKVLEAVPKQDVWSAQQILGEMGRTGSQPDFTTMRGCLNSLKDAHLVREPEPGHWQRVAPRQVITRGELRIDEPAPPTPAPPPGRSDTLSRIAELSQELRTVAAKVTTAAAALDDVAIEIEERLQVIDADGQKLRQLQSILKSIGV